MFPSRFRRLLVSLAGSRRGDWLARLGVSLVDIFNLRGMQIMTCTRTCWVRLRPLFIFLRMRNSSWVAIGGTVGYLLPFNMLTCSYISQALGWREGLLLTLYMSDQRLQWMSHFDWFDGI